MNKERNQLSYSLILMMAKTCVVREVFLWVVRYNLEHFTKIFLSQLRLRAINIPHLCNEHGSLDPDRLVSQKTQ